MKGLRVCQIHPTSLLRLGSIRHCHVPHPKPINHTVPQPLLQGSSLSRSGCERCAWPHVRCQLQLTNPLRPVHVMASPPLLESSERHRAKPPHWTKKSVPDMRLSDTRLSDMRLSDTRETVTHDHTSPSSSPPERSSPRSRSCPKLAAVELPDSCPHTDTPHTAHQTLLGQQQYASHEILGHERSSNPCHTSPFLPAAALQAPVQRDSNPELFILPIPPQAQLSKLPFLSKLAAVDVSATAPYKRGVELAEGLKDRWETSDHPVVHKVEVSHSVWVSYVSRSRVMHSRMMQGV